MRSDALGLLNKDLKKQINLNQINLISRRHSKPTSNYNLSLDFLLNSTPKVHKANYSNNPSKQGQRRVDPKNVTRRRKSQAKELKQRAKE